MGRRERDQLTWRVERQVRRNLSSCLELSSGGEVRLTRTKGGRVFRCKEKCQERGRGEGRESGEAEKRREEEQERSGGCVRRGQ